MFGVRVAPAHEEPRSGSNNSEHESTSGRSTNYESGHLIRVFRDIGRIFSLLFLLSHPSPGWSLAEKEGSKAEDRIWFRRRRKQFQLCFVRNLANENPARAVVKGRGLGNPPSSASKLFLVKRAPLVKRVGATEVPAGTRNTVWYGASMV
jgi:hypothetical protein